jgi:hypothetical protein
VTDDHVGTPRAHLDQGLNEHQQRLAGALAFAMHGNHPPQPHTVPAVMVNWDFTRGLLTIAHCFASELEVHIVYLRISDVQSTFAQMMDLAAQQRAASDPYLKQLGDVMAGRPVAHLIK